MKTLFISLLFLFFSNFCLGQSISSFFRNNGIETLAMMAHPTNTYMNGSYEIYTNKVWVKIYYQDYTTVLELKRKGHFFTKISIISDTDWANAFSGIAIIKDMTLDFIGENIDKEDIRDFEKILGKPLSEMSGKDMACLTLTLEWLSY